MRKKIFALALAAAMTATSAMSAFAADTDTDLLGHYTFDDTLSNEKGGEATGVLKTTTDGQVGEEGTVTASYAEGLSGKALDLGSTCTEGAIKLDVKPSSNSFSVVFAIKGSSYLQSTKPLIWIGAPDQSTEAWFSIKSQSWEDGGLNGPMVWSKSDGTYIDTPSSDDSTITALATDQWNLVAVVFENDEAQIYVNGEKTYSGAVATGVITDETVILLGGSAWAADYAPDTLMDELYVYDRALTEDDVKAMSELTGFSEPVSTEAAETTTVDLKSIIDNDTYKSTTETTTEESSDNTWIYIVVGVAVVVVVAGAIVAVAMKGKKKDGEEE